MCRIFSASLGECVENCSQHLEPASTSCNQLANEFINSFSQCLPERAHTDSLLDMVQGADESFSYARSAFSEGNNKDHRQGPVHRPSCLRKGLDKKRPATQSGTPLCFIRFKSTGTQSPCPNFLASRRPSESSPLNPVTSAQYRRKPCFLGLERDEKLEEA